MARRPKCKGPMRIIRIIEDRLGRVSGRPESADREGHLREEGLRKPQVAWSLIRLQDCVNGPTQICPG